MGLAPFVIDGAERQLKAVQNLTADALDSLI